MKQKRTRIYQRKTFILGNITAKYYGELVKKRNLSNEENTYKLTVTDSNIDSVKVKTDKEGSFGEFVDESKHFDVFLPDPLPCNIKLGKIDSFVNLKLHDVKISNLDFAKYRKYHQIEDNEIFGTFEGKISGYILEEFESTDIIEIEDDFFETHDEQPVNSEPIIESEKKAQATKNSARPNNPISSKFKEAAEKIKTVNEKIKLNYTLKPWFLAALFIVVSYFFEWYDLVFLMSGLILVHILLNYSNKYKKALNFIIAGLALYFIWLAFSNDQKVLTNNFKNTGLFTSAYNPNNQTLNFNHSWKDFKSNKFTIYSENSSTPLETISLNSDSSASYFKYLNTISSKDSLFVAQLSGALKKLKLNKEINRIDQFYHIVSFVQNIPFCFETGNNVKMSRNIENNYYHFDSTKTLSNITWGLSNSKRLFIEGCGDADTKGLLLYRLLKLNNFDALLINSDILQHTLVGVNLPISGHKIRNKTSAYVLVEPSTPIRPGLLINQYRNLKLYKTILQ